MRGIADVERKSPIVRALLALAILAMGILPAFASFASDRDEDAGQDDPAVRVCVRAIGLTAERSRRTPRPPQPGEFDRQAFDLKRPLRAIPPADTSLLVGEHRDVLHRRPRAPGCA